MNVDMLREQFMTQGLSEEELAPNPFKQFEQWYAQTVDAQIYEPGAMSLSTVDQQGQPWQRIVLLKLFDEKGFIFFTNYESRKAQHIQENAQVSLLFPWHPLGRQVKVTGMANKVNTTESLNYFITRPRGSQIGAWTSQQSQMLNSRSMLEAAYESMKRKFENKEVPLPPFWGGFRVTPKTFEFWQARESRLHDRFLFEKNETGEWGSSRLFP